MRRLRRLGLLVPRLVEREMYRRWEAMTPAEKLESIDAEAALTDAELREGWAELLEEIEAAGGDLSQVRADG